METCRGIIAMDHANRGDDFLSLILVEPIRFFKFKIKKKKVIFPSISDMGCFRVIQIQYNSIKNVQS